MRSWMNISFKTFLIIITTWIGLTFYVQLVDTDISHEFGQHDSKRSALIIFHPDAFYNLDEQVSISVADEMSAHGWFVKVKSTSAYSKETDQQADLILTCANTYNWAPDWKTSRWIEKNILDDQNMVLITLGSGSTKRAHRMHQSYAAGSHANVIDHREIWLLRPNDESQIDQRNVEVAKQLAREFTKEFLSKMSV